MPTERPAGVTSLAALGLAVCCGLPLLLSLGAGATIAGLGLRSWVLVGAGIVVVFAGALRWRRRGRRRQQAEHTGLS